MVEISKINNYNVKDKTARDNHDALVAEIDTLVDELNTALEDLENKISNGGYTLPVATSSVRGGIKIGYSESGANLALKLSSEKAYVALTKSAVTTALGYTPPTTNTTYSQATSSDLGLVKIGYSTSGKNYAVQLNSSGQMYVNVPWTDTNTNTTYSIATASTAGLVKPVSVITKPTLNSVTTTSGKYYQVQMSSDGNMFVNVPWSDTNTNTNYYHTTGTWSGLTYTATANGGAGALAFTIPTGTTSTTVAVGNHTHSYLPLSGGTLTGNVLLSNSNAQGSQPNFKWKTINSKTPYIGYCTSSTDGTFVIASLAGTAYNTGLSIGGSSGNLLWKGTKLATVSDIPSVPTVSVTQKLTSGTEIGSVTVGSTTTKLYAPTASGGGGTTSKALSLRVLYQGGEQTVTFDGSTAQTVGTSDTPIAYAMQAGNAKAVAWANVTGKPTFATVATTGSYNDLTDKPYIPSTDALTGAVQDIEEGRTQVGDAKKLNGQEASYYLNYNNLSNKPTIPSAYTLPTASSSTLGGIKSAANRTTSISPTTGGTTSGRYYGVELDTDGTAFVNVPWSNTNTITYNHHVKYLVTANFSGITSNEFYITLNFTSTSNSTTQLNTQTALEDWLYTNQYNYATSALTFYPCVAIGSYTYNSSTYYLGVLGLASNGSSPIAACVVYDANLTPISSVNVALTIKSVATHKVV